MKFTTKKLKQMIKEELDKMEVPEPQVARNTNELRMLMRKLASDQSQFEGITSMEAQMIYDLLLELMQQAKDDNSTMIMSRLQNILA